MTSFSQFSCTANKILFGILFAFSVLGFAGRAKAEALLPGDISSCGELVAPGTYILSSADYITAGTGNTCFTVTSPGVTITSAGTVIITGDISNTGNFITLGGYVVNKGTISGDVLLEGNSSNTGTISGNATALYPSQNPIGGTVLGHVSYHGAYNYFPTDGLVAYWKLDETVAGTAPSGTDFLDSSGNGNDGVGSNINYGLGGKINKAISSLVGLITVSPINMNGDRTLSAWSHFPLNSSGSGWRTLFQRAGGDYHHVLVDPSGYLGLYNVEFYTTGYNINFLSGWHQITAVGSAGETKFYVDGVLVGTVNSQVTEDLSVMGDHTGRDQGWGQFDEVGVWSRALSDSEVTGLYSNGNGITYDYSGGSSDQLYFTSSSNHDWSSLSNWWQDANFTIPALSLPISGDVANIFSDISSISGADAIASTTIFTNANFGTGLTLTSNTTFFGTSTNYGTINGDVTLKDDSQNAGMINGNAKVYAPSPNPIGGTVTGTVRYRGYPGTKYFDDTASGSYDCNWANAGNWWLDANYTIPADDMPTELDTVYIGGQGICQGVPNNDVTVSQAIFTGNAGWDQWWSWPFILRATDSVTFQDNSYFVYGEIYANTTFQNYAYSNNSNIYGDATFLNNSYNNSYISGSANFSDSSYNNGSVQNTCYFNDSSYNYGSCGNSIYHPIYWHSMNGSTDWNDVSNWWLDASSTIQASSAGGGNIILLGDTAPILNLDSASALRTIDSTGLTGDALATGIIFTSNNGNSFGGTLTGNATFSGSSYNSSNGVIYGGVTFNDYSYDSGTIFGNVVFTSSLYDSAYGIPSGDPTTSSSDYYSSVTFSSETPVSFVLHNSDYWSADTSSWIFTGGTPTWIFNDMTYNQGTLSGNATFENYSYNSGTVNGNASFHNTSYNNTTVSGVCSLFDSSYNSGSCGSLEYHKPFYFNNAAGDGDWNNPANWWYDASFTVQAVDASDNGTIPKDGDTVYLYAEVTTPPATQVNLGNMYVETPPGWTPQYAGNKTWYSITSTPNGDVYAVAQWDDIYKQTSGTGDFVAQNAGNKTWYSITSTPNGDMYAVAYSDDIYKQTGGQGDFVAQYAGNKIWYSITSTPNGDVYAVAQWDDIYKQTGGTGDFVAQNAGGRNWQSITSTPNGDVYAVVYGDDIYKQPDHTSLSDLSGISATDIYIYDGAAITGVYSGNLHIFGNRSLSQVSLGTWTGGNIEFNGTTVNDITVNGNATFTGTNQNNGTINGNVTNTGTLSGTGTTTGETTNTGTINSGTFVDTVTNIAGSIGGAVNNLATMIFNGASRILSGGSISGGGQFNDSSSNAGVVSGDVTFNDYSSNASSASLSDGLVAYWKLDEVSGTRYDSSGNGHDLTDNGSVGSVSVDGKGVVASFNNNYLESNLIASDINAPNDVSVAYWVNIQDPNNFSQVLGQWAAGGWTNLDVWPDGRVRWMIGHDGLDVVFSNPIIQPYTWNYIVGTWNGNSLKIYVNGVLDAETPYSSFPDKPPYVTNGSATLKFGKEDSPGGQFYLAKAGVWNRALSDDEIQSLYDNGDGLTYPFVSVAGHVVGNATFVGDNSENTVGDINGVVDGAKSRLYTALAPQVKLLRDFTDSAWTIIADNTLVKLLFRNLINLFTPNSPTRTTLVTRNGGYILAPLDPSQPVTSCGVLDVPGATYTLATSTNIAGYQYDTCFIVRADNITLNGNGRTISAVANSTGTAILAMASSTLGDTQTNAFTNLIIKNIKFSNFAHGIVAKGLDVPNGAGGDGASTTIIHSILADVNTSGGDPDIRGGNGGSITFISSKATALLSDGGDTQPACGGMGGNGGDIDISKDSLVATTSNKAGNSVACPEQPSSHGLGGHSHNTVVPSSDSNPFFDEIPTPSSTPTPTPTVTPIASNSGGSRSNTSGLAPIFTVLPTVNKLDKVKLQTLPTFGDTTSKSAFSFSENLSSFLFAPLPQTLTQTLGKDLTTYLKLAGFSREQDIITIAKKPLLLPKATTTVSGLFTVTTKGLPIKTLGGDFTTDTTLGVSAYLTADKKGSLIEKVKVTAHTEITITLKGATTATFNEQTLTFTHNTLTLTTPTKPGTYTLTSPASPLTLLIEVSQTTAPTTTDTQPQNDSWFNRILNYFF